MIYVAVHKRTLKALVLFLLNEYEIKTLIYFIFSTLLKPLTLEEISK
jgi:hypothetical protein